MERILQVLRIRDFFFLTMGNTVSQFGDRVTHMALITIIGIYEPGSHLAFSKMALFFTLPVIIFGPVSGIVSDVFSRRLVLLFGDISRAVLVLLIPVFLLTTENLLPVYIVIFLVFSLGLFFNVAKLAIIPDIVPRDSLLTANSVNTLFARFATVLGTLLGGIILDRIGWRWGFVVDSSTYILSFVFIFMIASTLRTNTNPVSIQDVSLRRVREAFSVAMSYKEVRFLFLTVIGFGFISAVSYVLFVPHIQQILGRGTGGVGIAGGILAFGMIAGAFLLGWAPWKVRKPRLISMSLFLLGIMLILSSSLPSYKIIVIGAFFAGNLTSFILISQDTLFQEVLPISIRGRIFGIKEWIVSLAFLVSTVAVGLIADTVGTGKAFIASGLFLLFLALSSLWFFADIEKRT